MTDIKYPAICVVHWPNGPVNACAEHRHQLQLTANFLGVHIAVTNLEQPAECSNCINEHKSDKALEE